MMLHAPILLFALLVPQGEGDSLGSEARTWGDVELPVGFHLDLATGSVSNRAPLETERGVVWDGESLRGSGLLILIPGAAERDVIARGEGLAPQPGAPALKNTEWTYSVGEFGWGYLRALQVGSGRISLERAHLDIGEPQLSRAPAEISWRSLGESLELSWADSSDEDARWIVQRRKLRSGVSAEWTLLGVSSAALWTDSALKPDVVYEYRVLRESGGLGARVRAVAGGLFDGLLETTQGVDVNVLSGEINGERSDLRVEYINPKGVQISPSAGVLVRTMAGSGRDAWEVPSSDVQGYGPQRYFVSVGRDLAVYLAEGLYARVSLNKIEDGKAGLRVNVALDGGRILLPAPTLESSEWLSSGEVEIKANVPKGHEGLGLGEPTLTLEAERGFQSEEWITLSEHASGDGELLRDEAPGESGPKRYRARLHLGRHGPSSPSAPITVLVGDDGGEQAEGWIREAVAELGERDYSRRQRAREVLAVIGERARPLLLEVISSDNPEQAAAARELLSSLGQKEKSASSAVALLPEVLMKRAGELGLSAGAMPGFLDPDPTLRAFGALRVIDPESVRAHLELLADSDSEFFVREAAEITLSLPARRAAQELSVDANAPTLSTISEELDAYGSLDVNLLADSFALAAAELEAWHALVSFQVARDLRASRGDELEEEAAIERARLALALLAKSDDGEEVPASFLAAALDVVRAPLIRQEAARAFAESRFAEHERVDEPLRVVAGDFDDLAALLDECRRSGRGDQILIPEGDYEAPSGASSSLRMGGQGVHLIGEGEVRIYASLLIEADSKVTLENLHIGPRSGIGITITEGELTLIDSRLSLQSMGVQATDSVVALSGTVIADPPRSAAAKGGAMALRFVGMSALIARNSQISTSASCAHGPRFVHIDTCTFMAKDRCAVEGQGSMEVFVERSLLFGGYAALSGPSSGVIDGVVLESPGHVALRVGAGLHLCREHVRTPDETGELWLKGSTIECTFGER